MLAYQEKKISGDFGILEKDQLTNSYDFIFNPKSIYEKLADESFTENYGEKVNVLKKGKTKFILNIAYFISLIVLLSILFFT